MEGLKRRLKKRWNPKEWKPEYEVIVALSCTGLSHSVIGERFGYTPVHIGNIVNCEYGKALRQIILNKLRNDVSLATPDLIKDTQTKAVERIAKVINDEALAFNNPLAIFDRSLKFLQASGQFDEPSNDTERNRAGNHSRVINNNQTNIAIGTDAIHALQEGTKRALEVQQAHAQIEPRGIGTGTAAEKLAKQKEILRLQAENVASPVDLSSEIKSLERQVASETLKKSRTA